MKAPKLTMDSASVAALRLYGDPKRTPEPETIRVYFPGGEVELTRCSDGDYWVHVKRTEAEEAKWNDDAEEGAFKGARLDQRSKSASDSDLGDFEAPDLYHVAVRIGKAGGA